MKNKTICNVVQQLVHENHVKNQHPSKIAQMLNISNRSVYRILKNKFPNKRGKKITYDTKNLQFQCRQAVKNLCQSKQKVASSKVHTYISEKVSLRTLQKQMKKDPELIYKKIPKRIILSEKQKCNRMNIIKK